MQFRTEFYATDERATVFVIESEQVVRSALHYILRDRHRTVTLAALDEAFACSTDVPDVVLLGIAFVQADGEAILAQLDHQFPGVRILIVAERNSDPLAQTCVERGAHGVIGKPISFDLVCDAVDAALAPPIAPGEPHRLIRVAFG